MYTVTMYIFCGCTAKRLVPLDNNDKIPPPLAAEKAWLFGANHGLVVGGEVGGGGKVYRAFN